MWEIEFTTAAIIMASLVWCGIAIVMSVYNEHNFEDSNWREGMYDGLEKIRKIFGINLLYEIVKILAFILWVMLYPIIFTIKLSVVGFDVLWLFKKVE